MARPRTNVMEHFGKAIVETTGAFDPIQYERSAKRWRRLLPQVLALPRSSRILDVACGDGTFLYFLKQAGFTNLYGIDTSEDRLARCRAYVTSEVECADAYAWLPSHAGQFDLVACNHLIEHIPDPGLYDLMDLLTDAVAPAGHLYLTTPNGWSPWVGFLHHSDLTHVRMFTPHSLVQLLALYGFQAQVWGEGSVPYDLPTTLRWMAWKIREATLKLDFRIQIGGTRTQLKVPFVLTPNIIAFARRGSSHSSDA